ncbi:MAG: helix-turn-helix domain-containing protein [Synergistaceae bacterium]|nr:helix-turn-helix domain-containing protein [Synergistaceae bacterium]
MEKIHRTIGVCRFVYNLFIATNQQSYKAIKRVSNILTLIPFLSG